MKKIISIAVCFFILLSCVLPVQASGGVPEKVMESTKSVVRILSKYYGSSATGSGFVIKNEPGEVLIATNDHVVSGNPYSISVWVGENELVDAEIVFTTSAKDLCVLRVTDPIDMKPLTLSTEDPQHGAAIYVVGYPGAGDILSDTQAHTSDSVTITDGIISAIRTFTIENGAAPVKLLQVNAAINSGNSGGPLFNSEGVVIGVNTYKVNANSQGVFGSVDISELWGLLEQHGIEIPMQQEVIPEVKEFPETIVAVAAGALLALILIFVLIKAKKKKTKTLRKYMETHPNGLGVSEAVSMLLPVAIQLRDLHNNGKLHLQVSPDSILVSAAGVILKESSKKETDRLSSGFAAPEIYKGVGFGAASDIYSLAAVLYFAATGKTPANSLQGELLDAEFVLLEERETVFAGIIRKSMAFLSQDRVQSMQEMIYGISAFSTQISNQETRVNKKEPVKPSKENKKRKSGRKLVPIASVLLCVIAAAMLWKPYVQPEIDARNEEALLEEQYIAAIALMEEGRYEEAMEAFAALTGYKDSDSLQENCRIASENAILEGKYQAAVTLAESKEYSKAAIAFAKLDGYKDAREKSFEMWKNVSGRSTVSFWHDRNTTMFFALRTDGTIAVDSYNSSSFTEEDIATYYTAGYTDIVSIHGVVGLRYDGTLAIPESDYRFNGLKDWTDIVEISAYNNTYVGLKVDGTVVSNHSYNSSMRDWNDIIAIANGGTHVVGLKSDGTVLSVGNNDCGQCDVDAWSDIIDIAVQQNHQAYNGATFGLKGDGTIIATGSNHNGALTKVNRWKNVVKLEFGPCGIREDGSAVAALAPHNDNPNDVGRWKDIVNISTDGIAYTVGQKADGLLVFTRSYLADAFARAKNWEDIQIP